MREMKLDFNKKNAIMLINVNGGTIFDSIIRIQYCIKIVWFREDQSPLMGLDRSFTYCKFSP